MHKIDAPHATASNEFTDGSSALGIEATELIAKGRRVRRLDKVFYEVLI